MSKPERIPYGFTDWNSPLAQREIWGAPKLYEWQEMILGYFAKNLHVHAVMSTPNEKGSGLLPTESFFGLTRNARLVPCGRGRPLSKSQF